MLKPFALSVIVMVAACGGWTDYSSSGEGPRSQSNVIDLRVGAAPVETTIQAGESVAWRSADGMSHTAVSSSTPQAFAEVDVPGGAVSGAVRFATPGDYPYFCSVHGVQHGSVHVIGVQ